MLYQYQLFYQVNILLPRRDMRTLIALSVLLSIYGQLRARPRNTTSYLTLHDKVQNIQRGSWALLLRQTAHHKAMSQCKALWRWRLWFVRGWLTKRGTQLTNKISLRIVSPIVFFISVGCETLIFASILHLELGNVQKDWVTLDPLHVDFPTFYPLCIQYIREGVILGANDLDFLGGGCWQVNRPLEMLLRRSLVASHIAADADGVTFRSK